MHYYRPAPGSSAFIRPYRNRYVCGKCGKRAIVTPYDRRRNLIPLAFIGFVAGLCLYFSNPLENIERDAFKRVLRKPKFQTLISLVILRIRVCCC